MRKAEHQLRLLFAEAKRCQPATRFSDELDSLALRRQLTCAQVCSFCMHAGLHRQAAAATGRALCKVTAFAAAACSLQRPACCVPQALDQPGCRCLAQALTYSACLQVRSSKQDQIHNSIVSTLLALMDGLEARGQVVLIGATNRVDAIDEALRRPGRRA